VILRRECRPGWLVRDPDKGKSQEYDDVWNSPTEMLFNDIVAVLTEQLAREACLPAAAGRCTWPRKQLFPSTSQSCLGNS